MGRRRASGGDRAMAEGTGSERNALVYYLYGEDDYRREEALERLLDTLLPEGVRELNLDQVRVGERESGSLLASARTMPFLAARRVVLIRGADALSKQQEEELLSYLNDPSPTTCLILAAARLDLRTRLAGALQQKGIVRRFERLGADSMKDQLLEAARVRGKRLSPDAITLLVALAGDDLRQSIYGVEKAALFVGEREEITPQDIEALVGETRARSIFQLTDAVGVKNLEGALRCLGSLLAHGEEPLAILGMVARQIRLLARAKALRDLATPLGEMARTLALPPRVVESLAQQSTSRSWTQLAAAFRSLYRADLAIKTGGTETPAVLHRLVWDLCRA